LVQLLPDLTLGRVDNEQLLFVVDHVVFGLVIDRLRVDVFFGFLVFAFDYWFFYFWQHFSAQHGTIFDVCLFFGNVHIFGYLDGFFAGWYPFFFFG
jgi:hypothetical protein